MGAQTQRSKENFPIGREHMPMEVIRALAILKRVLQRATISSASCLPPNRMRLPMQRTRSLPVGLTTISRLSYGRQEAERSPI